MQLCIVLLLVVWFEFEFVEFKFKSNLLNLFVKKKIGKNLFGPNQQSGPFLSLTRKPKIPLHPYINTAPAYFFSLRRAQAAAGPRPLPFSSCAALHLSPALPRRCCLRCCLRQHLCSLSPAALPALLLPVSLWRSCCLPWMPHVQEPAPPCRRCWRGPAPSHACIRPLVFSAGS